MAALNPGSPCGVCPVSVGDCTDKLLKTNPDQQSHDLPRSKSPGFCWAEWQFQMPIVFSMHFTPSPT
eukprot:1460591-Amphidinium_carterae.2